jgi:hypothetical protein
MAGDLGSRSPAAVGVGRVFCIVCRAIWLPILMLLAVLEPLVRCVCSGLALLGVLATLFFELVGPPHFPAWTMLLLSAGFATVPIAYARLIRLFSG